MRIVAEVPHPEYKVTIYAWNNKYLLKIETAQYEQTYKISEADLTGDDDIKTILADEEFMNSVLERFRAMNKSWAEAVNKVI